MSDHLKAWQQIPWLVNGTLEGEALDDLHQHLSVCAECRAEVALQGRLRDAMAVQPTVEFAPQASFNKLWARIDADAQKQAAPSGPPQRRWLVWGLAAQWLLMAGAAWWYVQATSADYRTVTSDTAPVGEVKVVFDGSTTLAEVGAVLADAGLVSIAGPTPAGVFVLSRDAQHAQNSLDAIVMRLRTDPRVRFAERSMVAE